jgi:hypothetical protein
MKRNKLNFIGILLNLLIVFISKALAQEISLPNHIFRYNYGSRRDMKNNNKKIIIPTILSLCK